MQGVSTRHIRAKAARVQVSQDRALAESLERRVLLTTFVVTNTGDTGTGSLRQAIVDSNGDTTHGTNIIDFSIGKGLATIKPATPLPPIMQSVDIDGTSQPGFNPHTHVPLIELDGENAGVSSLGGLDGLEFFGGSGSMVRGLIINRFASGAGVVIAAGNTGSDTVAGNYIGTDASGTQALGNREGVIIAIESGAGSTIGGTSRADRNVISGNQSNGIEIDQANGNTVAGNYIGTDASGTKPLSNGGDGVFIFGGILPGGANAGNQNIIGGSVPAAGNTIAFNHGAGVGLIISNAGAIGIDNSIRLNSIFSNAGLGIDLGDDGVTANDPGDADGGPNDLQNFPVLTSATSGRSGTTVAGNFNSTANTNFVLDFYATPALSPGSSAQGKAFLGTLAVTTDGSGNATFSGTLRTSVPVGQYVTATATDATVSPAGDTSEFSLPVQVIGHRRVGPHRH